MRPETMEKLHEIINDATISVDEKFFRLRNLVHEREVKAGSDSPSLPAGEVFEGHMGPFFSRGVLTPMAPSGFGNLDRITGGFAPGEYVIIGGRPGMGKSMLLVDLAMKMSVTGPVLFFSYDLTPFILTARMASSLSRLPVDSILQGTLPHADKLRLESVGPQLRELPVYINEGFYQSIHALVGHCTQMVREKGVKTVIIDYLQLMGTYRYRSNREMEMSYISRELKNMARSLGICVIAGSQLSRAVETRGGHRRPILSDLRDSGSIEQDADKVIFLYRAEYYHIMEDEEGNSTSGVAELIVAKNRNGKTGTARLWMDPGRTGFTDLEDYINVFVFNKDRMEEIGDTPF